MLALTKLPYIIIGATHMDATTILNTVVTGVVGLFGAVAGYLGATKAAQRQINANKTQLAFEYAKEKELRKAQEKEIAAVKALIAELKENQYLCSITEFYPPMSTDIWSNLKGNILIFSASTQLAVLKAYHTIKTYNGVREESIYTAQSPMIKATEVLSIHPDHDASQKNLKMLRTLVYQSCIEADQELTKYLASFTS